MLFSPHEPRNVPERFVALIPKVCTRAVEDRKQGQFRRWAPAPNDKMGQDKLPELLATQSHRNPLLLLTFRNFVPPRNGILDGVWR